MIPSRQGGTYRAWRETVPPAKQSSERGRRGAQMRGGTAEDSSLSDTSRFRPLLQDILEDISAGKLSADEYPVRLLQQNHLDEEFICKNNSKIDFASDDVARRQAIPAS